MNDDFVSASEAASILGVSYNWVTALCREGILEAKGGGKGRAWRISRDSVEEFARECSEDPDPDELENLLDEIENDQEEAAAAYRKGEESWVSWLVDKAKKYGPGALVVIGGIVTCNVDPVTGVAAICTGLAEILRESRN